MLQLQLRRLLVHVDVFEFHWCWNYPRNVGYPPRSRFEWIRIGYRVGKKVRAVFVNASRFEVRYSTNCLDVYCNQFWTDYIHVSIEEKHSELITRNCCICYFLRQSYEIGIFFFVYYTSIAVLQQYRLKASWLYLCVFRWYLVSKRDLHRSRNNCFAFAFEWIRIILSW